MPRTARLKSESGIYHAVIRGNNKQRVFEEEADYQKYLWILGDQQRKYKFILYSWCLMPNHIHLLIKEKETPIAVILRTIGTKFVYWYNHKYKRVGHLFQDRYGSEVVEDQYYFQKVIRYIHLNPVKSGLCQFPEEYSYSSYSEIFDSGKYSDTDLIFRLFPKKEFEEYHREKNNDICLDFDHPAKRIVTDDTAEKIICKAFGCDRIAQVQELPEEERTRAIRKLIRAGCSMPQISRLTGVSIGIIEKIRGMPMPD